MTNQRLPSNYWTSVFKEIEKIKKEKERLKQSFDPDIVCHNAMDIVNTKINSQLDLYENSTKY